ncbi:hypothetical protein F5B19DRAFT_473469 [Rostrohypoxylon terebratum]|nr:hypothetical protein F5B19DRAFT_473469 [Rostrohypoxylon terebratum]
MTRESFPLSLQLVLMYLTYLDSTSEICCLPSATMLVAALLSSEGWLGDNANATTYLGPRLVIRHAGQSYTT